MAHEADFGRAGPGQAKPEWDRYGEAMPAPAAPAAAPAAPAAAPAASLAAEPQSAPAPLPSGIERGKGLTRSLGLSPGAANKPAGEPAGFGFQPADSGAGVRGGQFGGMPGGADQSKRPAMTGRRLASPGASAAPVPPPAPRVVGATAPAKSVEEEKKPAPAAKRESLVALNEQSRVAESRDKQPQLKNMRGVAPGAAIDGQKVASAGAMPGASRGDGGSGGEKNGAARPAAPGPPPEPALTARAPEGRMAEALHDDMAAAKAPLGEVQNGSVPAQDDRKTTFAFKASAAGGISALRPAKQKTEKWLI